MYIPNIEPLMLCGLLLGEGSTHRTAEHPIKTTSWVAVKELNVGYYFGETILITIDTNYGNLI